MILETKRPWPLMHIETGRDGATLLPGRHRVELVYCERHDCRYLCLPGQPWGASLLSWCQWSPGMRNECGEAIDRRDYEVCVYGDDGRRWDEDGIVTAEASSASSAPSALGPAPAPEPRSAHPP